MADTNPDYFNAFVDEFHEVLSREVGDEVARDDCPDPLLQVLGNPLPAPRLLAALPESALVALRDSFREWLESDSVETAHIREALDRVLQRWPSSQG